MEQLFDILRMLQGMYIFEILLLAAGFLILVDYLFPTDVPAHVGYFFIAAAVFFRVSNSFFFPTLRQLLLNAGIAVFVWIALGILHKRLFRRYLDNVPDSNGLDGAKTSAQTGAK